MSESPPGFFGDTLTDNPMDLWVPLSVDYLTDAEAPYSDVPSMAWLRLIGRLRRGATTAGVAARLTANLRHWLTSEDTLAPQYRSQLKDQLSQQIIRLGPGGQGVLGALPTASPRRLVFRGSRSLWQERGYLLARRRGGKFPVSIERLAGTASRPVKPLRGFALTSPLC